VLAESIEQLNSRDHLEESGAQEMAYGRKGTPTSWALENAVAELEGGHRCLTYSSGLGAVTGALLSFLKAGDHLLMTDSVYAPTRKLCNTVLKRFGIETTYYDPLSGADICTQLRANTTVVFTESPGSHTFEVQDIPAIAEAAHTHGAKVLMDNTWASPLFFKPFEHGVDVSIQSGTKYIVGHADAMLGTVSTTKEAWPELRDCTASIGQCSGPDDLYLAQRGFRTLAVRLRQHQSSALKLAEWLQRRPEIRQVLYPALPGALGHEIWKRDFLGASGLFGIELEPCAEESVVDMLNGMRLFGMGYSWGGYESLLIPANVQKIRTVVPWRFEGPLLRIHIGLEDVDDLKDDLKDGLKRLRNFRG
jgi:cystathionine beta-lyase